MREFNFPEGEVLLIDKLKNWTSFDVIRKLQGATKYRKFGHAGTLDPLATGLLIICSGKKTKTIDTYQSQVKEYEVEFYFGGVTKTYDSEFPPENFIDPSNISKEQIQEVVDGNFLGYIEQIPPVFSAIKVDGVRAYKKARKGEEITLRPRIIEINKFQILDLSNNHNIKFENGNINNLILAKAVVVCSKGTYIRTLVDDLGKKLGVGAYIKELRRTKIGDYSVNDAISLEKLLQEIS